MLCIQDVHTQDRAIGQQIAINNPQEVLGVWAPNDALKFVGKTSLGVLLSHEAGFVVMDSGYQERSRWTAFSVMKVKAMSQFLELAVGTIRLVNDEMVVKSTVKCHMVFVLDD